jgi:predicted nucleic acid-binding protein
MAFVIDASIVAAFAFGETDDARVLMAIEELKLTEASTPCVFFFQIRNALIVGERRGRSTAQKSADFLRDLENLPLRIVPLPGDDAVMSLARERNLTVCDAAYLELAKREGLPLATLDRALEKAAIAEGVALFGA